MINIIWRLVTLQKQNIPERFSERNYNVVIMEENTVIRNLTQNINLKEQLLDERKINFIPSVLHYIHYSVFHEVRESNRSISKFAGINVTVHYDIA